MDEVLIFATVLAPIVAALVELFKKTFPLKNNVIPLFSLIVGVVIGAAAYIFTDLDTVSRLWAGGFAGLAATGLFELVKQREGTSK